MVGLGLTLWQRPSPAPEFSPLSLGDLALWLDGSDVTTMRQFANGSTAVGASGDPVGQWMDRSGNLRHVSQSTNSKRATYITNALGGRSVVRFDGADDVLTRGSFPYPAAFTVLAVALVRSGVGFDQTVLGNNAGGTRVLAVNLATGGNSVGLVVSPDLNAQQSDTEPYSSWGSPLLVAARYSLGSAQVWVNGVSNGATVAAYTASTQNMNLGGRDVSGSSPLNGDVAEVLLYGRALTLPDMNLAQSYLAAKWGLTAQVIA